MKVLYKKRWFTPVEIAKQGLIQCSRGDKSTVSGNYAFVMRLIKTGRLKARNYSTGNVRQLFLVSEDQIEQYHKNEGK